MYYEKQFGISALLQDVGQSDSTVLVETENSDLCKRSVLLLGLPIYCNECVYNEMLFVKLSDVSDVRFSYSA